MWDEKSEEQRNSNQRLGAGHSPGCSVLYTQLVSGLHDLDQTDVLVPFAFSGAGLSGQWGSPLGQQFPRVS